MRESGNGDAEQETARVAQVHAIIGVLRTKPTGVGANLPGSKRDLSCSVRKPVLGSAFFGTDMPPRRCERNSVPSATGYRKFR